MKIRPRALADLPKYAAALAAAGLLTGCGALTEQINPQVDGLVAATHEETEAETVTAYTEVTVEDTTNCTVDPSIPDGQDETGYTQGVPVVPGVALQETEDDYLQLAGDVVYEPELSGSAAIDHGYEEEEDAPEGALRALFEDAYRQYAMETYYDTPEEVEDWAVLSALETEDPVTAVLFMEGMDAVQEVSARLCEVNTFTVTAQEDRPWGQLVRYADADGTATCVAYLDVCRAEGFTASDAAAVVQELLQ